MNKFNAPNFEKSPEKISTREAYENIDPAILSKFRPANAEEAEVEFCKNPYLYKPKNNYENYTPESVFELGKSIESAIEVLENDQDLSKIEQEIYGSQIEVQAKRYKFLRAGLDFKSAQTEEEKSAAREEFMKYNREIWGVPERETFESLLGEKLSKLSKKEFDNRGRWIRESLLAEFPDVDLEKTGERFKPSSEVFEAFGDGVRMLFAEQLAQVPDAPRDGDKFSAQEIGEVFQKVLGSFEDGTEFSKYEISWKDSGAISVNSSKRQISISKNRAGVSKKQLEGLVAHEICTHYYRAQIGEDYGIAPLRKGLDGYLDTEEGIARAMEMAVSGKYVEAGVPHYLTAGMAEFMGANFRDAYEINWRIYALEDSKTGEISDEDIKKAQEKSYKNTQRIFRGTDEMPWFKDLSYYNGGQKIWQYIEKNIDDPMLFDDLLLGGKSNVFDKSHERILYGLKTQ